VWRLPSEADIPKRPARVARFGSKVVIVNTVLKIGFIAAAVGLLLYT
jgi:hypothetical protein